MRLPRILNQCHPIPGFVYERASFAEDAQTILIPVRPRETIRGDLLGLSSARAWLRPVSHAAAV